MTPQSLFDTWTNIYFSWQHKHKYTTHTSTFKIRKWKDQEEEQNYIGNRQLFLLGQGSKEVTPHWSRDLNGAKWGSTRQKERERLRCQKARTHRTAQSAVWWAWDQQSACSRWRREESGGQIRGPPRSRGGLWIHSNGGTMTLRSSKDHFACWIDKRLCKAVKGRKQGSLWGYRNPGKKLLMQTTAAG